MPLAEIAGPHRHVCAISPRALITECPISAGAPVCPDDIVKSAVVLAGDPSGMTTGQFLDVDGDNERVVMTGVRCSVSG